MGKEELKHIEYFEKKNDEDNGQSFDFLKSLVLEEVNQETKRLNKKLNVAIFLSLVALFALIKPLI